MKKKIIRQLQKQQLELVHLVTSQMIIQSYTKDEGLLNNLQRALNINREILDTLKEWDIKHF
tara:strand:- start:1341 stop:1526 length:186 start_codon:yes stop_codon:yes gene_type:complete